MNCNKGGRRDEKLLRKGLWTYLLLTFGLTWVLQIGVARHYEVGSLPYIAILVAVMFIPGLSALIVRLFIERQGFADAGLHWGRGRYYIVAWLLPAAFGLAAFGLAIWFRQAEFDPWMTAFLVDFSLLSPDTKMPPLHQMRIIAIVGNLLAVAINTIPCFGEEFGWRGYLLMRMLPSGAGRAMVLSGAIWGLWHAPVILRGHNYPDHPVLGVPLMIGFCILLGVILGWLRLASGSVFAAAVAHASVNGPANTPLLFLRGRNDITTGLTGLLGQAVMLVFVLLIWRLGAFGIRKPYSRGGTHVPDALSESGD